MTSPTQALRNEHDQILRLLDVMEKWTRLLRQGVIPNPAVITEGIKTFQDYADRWHHGREEDLLFPAMAKAEPTAQDTMLAVMRSEHDEGRALLGRSLELADSLGSGEEDNAGQLAGALSAFVALLRNHIHKENHVLFMLAEEWLTDDEMDDLARAFAAREEELGQDTPHKGVATIDRLSMMDPASV